MKNNISDLEIEKVTKTIVSKNKKVVAFHGVKENESYKLMVDLISLMNVEIPEWSSISAATEDQCISDIRNFLLANANIENFKNLPSDKFLMTYWKKKRLSKIIHKLDEIDNARQTIEISSRSRVFLMPVLTAFSTLGATLAIPLLSIAFLRTNEIVKIWGNDGFLALIGSCFALVIMVIIAAFVTLFNNLRSNRKDYILYNISATFKKIFDRYFTTDLNKNNYEGKPSLYAKFLERSKLVVSNSYTFFYDAIDISNPEKYLKILNYFKILNSFNNTIVYDASGFKYLDERKIFRNVFSPEKIIVSKIDKYKTKTTGRRLMNFIFYQLSLISNVNTRKLLQKYPFFVNALYRFLDYSETNLQLLNLLLDVKKHAAKASTNLDDRAQLFFVDFFSLVVFKSLDELGFEQLLNDISVYGKPTEETRKNTTYNSLKIEFILNRNVNEFGPQAFLFNLIDYFEEDDKKNIFIELSNSNKEQVYTIEKQLTLANDILEAKGYKKIVDEKNDTWYDARYSSLHDDDFYVKIIQKDTEINFLNKMDEIFLRALNDNVKNLIIYAFNIKMSYRLIDNEYELINETLI